MIDISFFLGSEFVKHEFGVPAFLIDPIIPTNGLVALHGKREAGKTQLALTLADSVLNGKLFLGLYQAKKGRVLFYQGDTPPILMQLRAQKAKEVFDRDDFAIITTPNKIDCIKLGRLKEPPGFITAGRDFSPDLVIVDSTRKVHSLDENDSNSPSQVYDTWKTWFPGATIVFIMHNRKTQSNKGTVITQDELDENFRGNTAWVDDVDTGIQLVRFGKKAGQGHKARISFSKTRTCETPPDIDLIMKPDSLLMELEKPTARQLALLYLNQNPEAEKQKLVQHLLSQGISSTQAYRVAGELIEFSHGGGNER